MKNSMLGLRTAIYQVSNIDAAKEWYSRAFDTQPYYEEPFYVGFDIGGYELGLQPEGTTHLPKTESVVAYWGVEDLIDKYRCLVAAGAIPFEEPRGVGGGISVAKVQDPWGNLIGLIYNPHFKGV